MYLTFPRLVTLSDQIFPRYKRGVYYKNVLNVLKYKCNIEVKSKYKVKKMFKCLYLLILDNNYSLQSE